MDVAATAQLEMSDPTGVVPYHEEVHTILTCQVRIPGITNGSYPRANSMHPGDTLSAGQILHSPGGMAELLIEDDGNMVLYRTVDRTALWSSGTQGKSAPGIHAILMSDGNFVLQTEPCEVWWESGTKNLKDPWLTVQDTGSVIILDGPDPIPKWTTHADAEES